MRMYPLVHPSPIFFGLFNTGFQASRSGVTSASAASVQGNMKAGRGKLQRIPRKKERERVGGKKGICFIMFLSFSLLMCIFFIV